MPTPTPYSRFPAIMAEVDAREWAGENLWVENAAPIAAPSTWAYFDDALAFLTGRGTAADDAVVGYASMAYGVQQALTVASSVTVGITSGDRVFILAAGLAGNFTLAAGAGNVALGFDAAGQTSVTVAGGEYMEATADWVRAPVVSVAPTVTSSVADGSTSGPLVLPALYQVQSPVDLARAWGDGDADDAYPTTNLSALGTGRWGIDASGHVWRARNTSGSPTSYALSWTSTTLRDFLGFTGQEAEVTTSGVAVLTATYPCTGVLCPTRPFDAVTRTRSWQGTAVQSSNGAATSATWLDQLGYILDLYLDGPADRIDLQDHYLRRVREEMPPGSLVTAYQQWPGQTRRTRRSSGVGSTQVPAYSTVYDSQVDGELGRLLCRRAVDDSANVDVVWPDRLQRRFPMQLRLTEREGGQ
jgi:hypothetical protein